ncbi:MAG: MFS transporter [Planctomycetota bacterium]
MSKPPFQSTNADTKPSAATSSSRLLRLWTVILAGEAIFLLPFVLPRLMRSAMLEQWDISNTELGTAFSVYGFVAIAAYAFGGPLADRFRPRKLMAAALLITAAAGWFMTRSPSAFSLALLYGFFGLSTILLFWSAMLRTTHDLAGDQSHGAAFGLLDAGRGLVAALIASGLVLVLGEEGTVTQAAWIAVGFVALTAAVIYFGLPDEESGAPSESFQVRDLVERAGDIRLWRQGFIVVCAYCGFKAIDIYGLFLVDTFGATDGEAAKATALTFWVRPVAAIAAGFAADRVGRFPTLTVSFVAMAATYGMIAACPLLFDSGGSIPILVIATLLSTAAFAYALRGVYFAVAGDLAVPDHQVGAAMGLISVVGFLPDVFFGPLSGIALDNVPGALGHQIVFAGTAVLALVGAILSIINGRAVKRLESVVESDPQEG